MRIERRFTTEGKSPYDGIEFRTATSEIRNPDGSLVFQLEGVEVPEKWSQVACDILAQKYFRKAGVPSQVRRVDEPGVPEWLQRHEADADAEELEYSSEQSSKQVFDRLAGTWTYWGWKGGYFDGDEDDAEAFYRRNALHAGDAERRRRTVPAMVQHRPSLGLRHRRTEPRPLLCRLPHGQA